MMNNDMLSQDEIDALLRGNDDQDDDHLTGQSPSEEHLSPMEQDALGEIGNISFGSSATALSTLLNQKVEITTPTVTTVHKNDLAEKFPHPNVAIQVSYTIGFIGANVLVIKQSDAAIIADLMLGGDGRNPQDLLGEIQLSAVQEAMNQMMGSAATSMSTIFNKKVDISPPSIEMMDLKEGEGDGALPNQDIFIQVAFRLKIGDLVDSNIMQLLPLEFGKSLVDELLNPSPPVAPKTEIKSETPSKENAYDHQPVTDTRGGQSYSQTTNHEYQGYQQPTHQQQHIGASKQAGYQPTVQPAAFSNFEPSPVVGGESKNLDMLLDIPLQVTVELGRTKRSVRDILELSTGSIIELDKLAGEPVDILVNNKLVAKGEVVVIDENFGVRVTDIISQSDRIKNLR
ncbi:flagellar motor switch protein FliN/FliY [Bacillus mesophilus]|uniref:Flagellar motor switch protein FliN n=1 Tax=Bacillus mesophilus TaxID=1808955 RepID=A0A6M0Q1M0_9BACI|nr:flagellar motor switch phosphatase FliY [Bacillus mesophilus]MBM7659353.1 flagellar motor switch protein FliN/FliY [Bacillus mesophilus]NEY70225.1 flagellar motor switch phosphatase FliY [Bacillus mesophilus]